MKITRRAFLGSLAGAAASAAGVGAYAFRVEPHWLEIVRRSLPLAELPPALAGATLLQISDVHIGRDVADEYVRHAFRLGTATRPDIVALTGDFISYMTSIDEPRVGALLAGVPRGRLATLAVLGNHDYGRDWASERMAAAVAAALRRGGARVLRNEVADVAGLRIFGFDDFWGPRFDPKVALRGATPDRAAIALCHNPDAADLPVWRSFRGWILSGHTHGGQVRPPFLPPPILPVRNRRYTAGAFALDGGRTLYVSRGVGHLWRVRFNVRPEITLFTLRDA